jgi:hypothetical protein
MKEFQSYPPNVWQFEKGWFDGGRFGGRAIFQADRGDETAFQFEKDGRIIAIQKPDVAFAQT